VIRLVRDAHCVPERAEGEPVGNSQARLGRYVELVDRKGWQSDVLTDAAYETTTGSS
jgi:hypothetical protein